MATYLIGIGGTGAKCIESFVHLAATGVVDGASVKVLFVDLDTSNGSSKRARTALRQYVDCRSAQYGDIEAFHADLEHYDPDIWTPLPESEHRSLRTFFNYADPGEHNQVSAKLMEALYTEKHVNLGLDEGFRGVTPIGAAVVSGTVNLDGEEPWRELFQDLQQDSGNSGGATIVLVGSVFGGTGASGVPTIGRLIADHLKQADIKNVRLSAVLMLPYFTYAELPGEDTQAKARDFLPNTQAALNYYHERRYLDVFQAGVYLLGEQDLANVPVPSVGGSTQRNDPHPLELYAALAIADVMLNSDEARGCTLIARNAAPLIQWSDLPAPLHIDLRSKVGQFLRFAYFYVSSAFPILTTYLRDQSRTESRVPWIRTYFPAMAQGDKAELEKQAVGMKRYCDSFLIWLGALHFAAREGNVQLGLAHPDKFVRLGGDPPEVLLKENLDPDFTNLLLPLRAKEGNDFKKVAEKLSEATPSVPHTTKGFGQFVHELYKLAHV